LEERQTGEGMPLSFHNMWTPDLLDFAKKEKHVPRTKVERVAIIGAGPAGLVAAYELTKCEGVHVDIYEEADRVGGRVLTVGEIGGFSSEDTPWLNDSLDRPVIGEAGAMRLPLIPDALAQGKWDMTALSDSEINELIHGKVVNGHAAEDKDFPMPLIRHYIKELGVPARRFNMNIAMAHVKVHLDDLLFEDTFVRQSGQLVGTDAYKGKTLDDSVVTFLRGSKDAAISKWLEENVTTGLDLVDVFEQDVTTPVIKDLTGSNAEAKNYLDLIDINSWSKFLVDWDLTYKQQLEKKGWPQKLVDFYGHVYRTDMDGLICKQVIEEFIGHWWQPNMFTMVYGMQSLYDAPKGKGFQGFRQVLESKGVKIKLGHKVDSVRCIKNPISNKDEAYVTGSASAHGEAFDHKYDVVLVTVPQPALSKIKFDWPNVNPSEVPYPKLQLAKRLFQFKDPFWTKPENNHAEFEINHQDGFAVFSSDLKKGHLSQLRYSNPELEGNVILNYEFADNAEAMDELSHDEILKRIQCFHKANVSEEAVLNDTCSTKKGVYSKPWLDITDIPNSQRQYEGMQKYCAENAHTSSLYFAGDYWSFCPQWQEGALYTALRAVYSIVNGADDAKKNFQIWQDPAKDQQASES